MKRRLLQCYRACPRCAGVRRDLFRRIKWRGGALLQVAECKDPGAQLRERPAVAQCQTADLFRRLFFATGFDLAPVVLGIPLAIRPMLHLVSSLCLHRVPRCFARGGYKWFLATIGRRAARIMNSQAALLPFSHACHARRGSLSTARL